MNSKNSMVKYAKIIKLLTIWPTDWIVFPWTWEGTRIIMDSVAIAIVAIVAIVADSVVIAIVVGRTGTISFTLNPCSCTFGPTTVVICHT